MGVMQHSKAYALNCTADCMQVDSLNAMHSRQITYLPYSVILILTHEDIIAHGLLNGVWEAHLNRPPQGLHIIVVHLLSQEHLPGCMVLLHAHSLPHYLSTQYLSTHFLATLLLTLHDVVYDVGMSTANPWPTMGTMMTHLVCAHALCKVLPATYF